MSIDIDQTPGAISRGVKSVGGASKRDVTSPLASTSQTSTRLPCSAASWARPAATVVLPTPPLPVTNTRRRSSRSGAARHRPAYLPRPHARPQGAPNPTRRSAAGAPDLDVGHLDDRDADPAALAVGQPEDPVAGLEQLLDVGDHLVAVGIVGHLHLELLGGVGDADTHVHLVSLLSRTSRTVRGPPGRYARGRLLDMTGTPKSEGDRAQRTLGGDDGRLLRAGPPGPCRLARPHRACPGGRRRPTTRHWPCRAGERSAEELRGLAAGARRDAGVGCRRAGPQPEQADTWRTSFERDRDRILHATSFRRLAGKTQVFVFPQDHQRTRLTHALEVAQVATAIARACRLNVALTEAIALGHDCGHGPGGHASEDALDPYVPGGFDHAPWGALVSLAPLNLCAETVDGIANHSWSRPAPSTPEGEVVSWADRIAYVCHDWEDAVLSGIVAAAPAPLAVRTACGERRSAQLGAFITGVVSATLRTGQVGMEEEDGGGARRIPGLQLRAHLPARRLAAPGRSGDRRAARAGRALLRPSPPASPEPPARRCRRPTSSPGARMRCGPRSPTWRA